MTDRLAQHFALVGDPPKEPGPWRPFAAADVLDGELWDDPRWPNRWRLLGRRSPADGLGLDFELHAKGDHVRVRLPIRLDPLPYDGDVVYGYAAVTDEGRPTKQWYEQVGDRTHLVIEAVQ